METAKINVKDQDPLEAIQRLLEKILSQETIDAVLVPKRLPVGAMVMPTLVSDPAQLEGVDPLAPAFALNAAKVVSRLTRKPLAGRLAVMLRACEIRAFIELVKLNQGSPDDLVILGMDCLGACGNKDYLELAGDDPIAASRKFSESVLVGQGAATEDLALAPACRVCEQPLADGADLAILLYGVDYKQHLMVQAQSEKGRTLLDGLGLEATEPPAGRKEKVQALIQSRTAQRDRMFQETSAAVDNMEKLSHYLAACVNCYNCRVACPVCYCRECVFVTDVFEHDPLQYLGWARRKGALKMPTDTLFYHLTRLAHMSTACVGCGQCSNACPNDIPVMELFRTVAHRTQAAFDYQAGADVADKPPLTEFKEKEFEDVVGISD
jgi:formate dehydrogenase (coenzyme F420) beta subunit